MVDGLKAIVDKALIREPPNRSEALRVLGGDDALIDVVAAGARVRTELFGYRVKLNTIINLKNDLCPEDCFDPPGIVNQPSRPPIVGML